MFITIYLLHVSVFVTPVSGRPLHYLLKNYKTCISFLLKHVFFEQETQWSH